jgi:hypothetical protein
MVPCLDSKAETGDITGPYHSIHVDFHFANDSGRHARCLRDYGGYETIIIFQSDDTTA